MRAVSNASPSSFMLLVAGNRISDAFPARGVFRVPGLWSTALQESWLPSGQTYIRSCFAPLSSQFDLSILLTALYYPLELIVTKPLRDPCFPNRDV
jgi:hypothetical protein